MSDAAAKEGLLLAVKKRLDDVGKVVMVGGGKGGVGKSLVACGLAISLAKSGAKVGVLDLDIHGASVPEYLGVGPPLESDARGLKPKRAKGLKVMSVGLFTGSRPVPMRGDDKEALVAQLFSLTVWGRLDYLVVDLPPGLADEFLTALKLFGRKASLVLVTTPSPIALKVVGRLRTLARGEGISLRGVVLNMSSMRALGGVIHPLGRADRGALESLLEAKVLAEVPFEPRVGVTELRALLRRRGEFSDGFTSLARTVSGTEGNERP